MKRSCNRPGTLWTFLAGTVLLAGIVGIVALPASSAENGTTCDIQKGSCLKETGDGMTVEFDVQPKPVATMSELTFIVNLTRGGFPASDASVALDLSMPGMFMGKNQPILKHAKNGRYEGKGVLVQCASGRKTWRADVTIGHGGKNAVASFVFEVK
jgi:hypothetical protein